jgi:hypothetical protein
MEEFDLNFDTNIGTSVSKLNNNNNSESDIDYDKILDKLDITETNDKSNNKLFEHSFDKHNDNSINMNHFAKKLENKLDNIRKERERDMFVDVKRPPAKMDVDSIKLVQKELKPTHAKKQVEEPKVSKQIEHKDIIIYIVLFIILNSKLVIELIYDKISFTQDKPYPNLLIRAIVFGGLLFFIKKFNLNS